MHMHVLCNVYIIYCTQTITCIIPSRLSSTRFPRKALAKIKGRELTPFLLKEIMKKTNGKSLEANKALALNNVVLGVEIVHQLG